MLPKLKYIFLLTVCTTARGGQFFSFEADSFPEEAGWTRDDQLFPAARSLEDGFLVLRAEIIPKTPPLLDAEQQDFYRRSLSDFAGTDIFFLEWRLETDGPRSGFPSVAPASIVAFGRQGIGYHFTIADDEVRLIRDNLLPIVFVNIEPGVPHTYRLELYGADSYTFLIDGEVVDSGIPEGAYPTVDSEIVFGGRAAIPDGVTTVRWDYVRYGSIPEPTTALILILGSLVLLRRRATP